MMKYVLSLVVVAILAGCTSTPNLPPRDTIVAMKPTESGIVASSAKYSYRFVRDGVPQEYQRYKTFYERFHQQASGATTMSAPSSSGRTLYGELKVLLPGWGFCPHWRKIFRISGKHY